MRLYYKGKSIEAEVGMVSDSRVGVRFRYNELFKDRIKTFEGAKWEAEQKVWSFPLNERNEFQFRVLKGENPYEIYDTTAPRPNTKRKLYNHQVDMVAQALHIRRCVFSCEMGTGKTLAAIEVMELSGITDWWYVAPRSALYAVQSQFRHWKSAVTPTFMTYEGMVKAVEQWTPGMKPPQGVIFDESSRLKTPTAKRSKMAAHLASAMREEHDNPFIILMSGSPAPKDPTDWWHQSEICQPGFITEGSPQKLKLRLSHSHYEEGQYGGHSYPVLDWWWDNEKRCLYCGKIHEGKCSVGDHFYQPSTNECANLYKRMNGLVLTKLKKDCLDLPEKRYKIIQVRPSESIIQLATSLVQLAPRVITALNLMRQLSDGFMYEKTNTPTPCSCGGDEECPFCGGTNKRFLTTRTTKILSESPKMQVVRSLLDEYEEDGRIVLYAGFHQSIDSLVEVCRAAGWNYIKADGRGWACDCGEVKDMLRHMDRSLGDGGPEKLAFVGQPTAAGMGLTLTRANTIVYVSNDFNGESRIQSEDRIHRVGMRDSATIIDVLHLPTDALILKNLKVKRTLQSLTMGDLEVPVDPEDLGEVTIYEADEG